MAHTGKKLTNTQAPSQNLILWHMDLQTIGAGIGGSFHPTNRPRQSHAKGTLMLLVLSTSTGSFAENPYGGNLQVQAKSNMRSRQEQAKARPASPHSPAAFGPSPCCTALQQYPAAGTSLRNLQSQSRYGVACRKVPLVLGQGRLPIVARVAV